MINWIVILSMFGGVGLLIVASRMDKESSFEDGTFILQILAGVAGIVLIVVPLFAKLALALIG